MRGGLRGADPVGCGAVHRRPDAGRGCVPCAGVPCFPLASPIGVKSNRRSSRSIFIISPNVIVHFGFYYLNELYFHANDYLISSTRH